MDLVRKVKKGEVREIVPKASAGSSREPTPDGTFMTRTGRPGSAGSFTYEQAPRDIDPHRGGVSRRNAGATRHSDGHHFAREDDGGFDSDGKCNNGYSNDYNNDYNGNGVNGGDGDGIDGAYGNDGAYARHAGPLLDFEMRGGTPEAGGGESPTWEPASARSELSERIARAETDRSERVRELDGFVTRLRSLYDEEGTPLVEFPNDFDEVVGTLSLEQIVSALPWTEAIFSSRRGDDDPSGGDQQRQLHKALGRMHDLDRELAARTMEAREASKMAGKVKEEGERDIPEEARERIEAAERLAARGIVRPGSSTSQRGGGDGKKGGSRPPRPNSADGGAGGKGRGRRGSGSGNAGGGKSGDGTHRSDNAPPVVDPRTFVPRMRADEEARVASILASEGPDVYGGDEGGLESTQGARPVIIPAGEGFAPSEDDARSLLEIDEKLSRLAPQGPGDDARSIVSSVLEQSYIAPSTSTRVTSSQVASAVTASSAASTAAARPAGKREDPVRAAREEREEREAMHALDGEIAAVYTRPVQVTEDLLRRLILEYHREVSGISDLGADLESLRVPAAVGEGSPHGAGNRPPSVRSSASHAAAGNESTGRDRG